MRVAVLLVITMGLLGLSVGGQKASEVGGVNTPKYTAGGKMIFPANYREWVYLSSGVDMSYRQDMQMDHSMFDNVFVNPEAYKYFVANGTWPDKTMLVLELRVAGTKSAINKAGHFQTTEMMGREVHVKDESRFPSKWAFFGFDSDEPSSAFPTEMDCYSCHQQHAAVDTTFVQFYPTLIELAKKKGTLSAPYLKDEAAAGAATKK
ncbi:MAG: cytochrome P460 family protein [Acidobacteriota bacterium]|nr:cytochrome P460 family protein [Acidobacteriota bacterium]